MLIAFPSHDVIWRAALSSAQESADSDYAIENLQDNDPSNTAKFTASSVNIQIDLTGGNVTVVGLGLINTSFTGGSFESGAGTIAASLTFPARTTDGKQRNLFLDLRGLSNVTDDHFELDLTSPAAVPELGRICLVTAWQEPQVLVDGAGSPPVFGRKRPGQVENVSRGGVTSRRVSPWAAIRRLMASTQDADTRDILDQLEAECLGLNRGFLLVPNEDVNDAWFAQCEMADFEYAQSFPDSVTDGIFPMRMTFLEISMGLPPALT